MKGHVLGPKQVIHDSFHQMRGEIGEKNRMCNAGWRGETRPFVKQLPLITRTLERVLARDAERETYRAVALPKMQWKIKNQVRVGRGAKERENRGSAKDGGQKKTEQTSSRHTNGQLQPRRGAVPPK
jgi:hypothetical protein